VMFADIVGFTAYCEAHAAEDVVDNLDRLARDCEGLMSAHGLEKIKSIGDGFVTTGNLLQPLDDPVMASVRCALAMLRAGAENPARWQLRVGIHVGPVVAGVVGQSKFSFDLWGDTVNVAARLSGHGSEAAIHLSGEAFARIEGRCRCTHLGPIEFKGGRRIVVYRYQHEVD
jgi:adenylate cyclase